MKGYRMKTISCPSLILQSSKETWLLVFYRNFLFFYILYVLIIVLQLDRIKAFFNLLKFIEIYFTYFFKNKTLQLLEYLHDLGKVGQLISYDLFGFK